MRRLSTRKRDINFFHFSVRVNGELYKSVGFWVWTFVRSTIGSCCTFDTEYFQRLILVFRLYKFYELSLTQITNLKIDANFIISFKTSSIFVHQKWINRNRPVQDDFHWIFVTRMTRFPLESSIIATMPVCGQISIKGLNFLFSNFVNFRLKTFEGNLSASGIYEEA